MGISGAVQWWEESQLRVLVLASLILQYFLAFASRLRKRCVPSWFRFFTWLAYLGSDAVAIYALATLFNRYRKQTFMDHSSGAGLQVLWAPILLLHLGGQDGITAYNIEDNELWRRHVLTSVSQVAVAIYVFCKSWSGERRLLQAAILIFVPGILKCLEKPWALKSASITSLTSSTSSGEHDHKGDEIKPLEQYVKDARKYCQTGEGVDHGMVDDKPYNLFVQVARKYCPAYVHHESGVIDKKPYNLFVDIAYPYAERLKNLKYMVDNPDKVHGLVQSGLSSTFDRLYTKEQVFKGLKIFYECSWKAFFGNFLRGVGINLSIAAIVLFHKSHKEAYNDIDVKITFTLLWCTFILHYLINVAKSYIDFFALLFGQPWPDQVAQYNLIEYLARNRKHTKLRKLATLLVCKDSLDQLWCMKPCKSSKDITKLIHGHVRQGWTDYIENTATYSSFNDNRGQRTLRLEKCMEQLDWSIKGPFDEAVLLWHLATDFCFYSKDRSTSPPRNIGRCREISNYMVYLLFVNPEMLMTGTRRSLFSTAYDKLKRMLPPLEGEERVQKINQLVKEGTQIPGIIDASCKLSKDLMGLGKEEGQEEGQEEKMWKVIEGVWVEMLCFSASRCRGYLHAKSLGKGGEYLSYVWLLLSYMGMETLAERLQRTDLPAEGDKGATLKTGLIPAEGDEDATTRAPTATPAPATTDEIV